MANVWGNIFSAVLGGIASSSERRAQREDTREGAEAGGRENRRTAAFEADQEYYYNQLMRDERRKGLDASYNQFSTIKNFAPNYVAPPQVALPTKPKPGDYHNG